MFLSVTASAQIKVAMPESDVAKTIFIATAAGIPDEEKTSVKIGKDGGREFIIRVQVKTMKLTSTD